MDDWIPVSLWAHVYEQNSDEYLMIEALGAHAYEQNSDEYLRIDSLRARCLWAKEWYVLNVEFLWVHVYEQNSTFMQKKVMKVE